MIIKPKNIVEIEVLQELFEEGSILYLQAIEIIGNPDRVKDFSNYLNYLFLIRFGYNFKAISSLLKLFQESSYFKIPIFLILRTCISDLLTYFYFIHIIRKNQNDTKKINAKVYGFFVDHLYRINDDLKNMYTNSEITEQEFNYHQKYLMEQFNDFYDCDSKLIKKELPNFKDIFEKLKVDPELSWVSNAYEHYKYMSKFEHVGVLTYEMQEFHKLYDWYDKNGIVMSFSLLNDGIYILVKSLKSEIMTEKLNAHNKKIIDSLIKS